MPFCYRCGGEIPEDARYCQHCGTYLKAMPEEKLFREKIEVHYPESSMATLEIVVGAPGKVEVRGCGETLVSGTVEYNVPEWAPRVEVRGDRMRLVQAESWEDKIKSIRDTVNRWDLRLGEGRPLSLKVKASVTECKWHLGGLPLTDLKVETGVSENIITFEGENPETLSSFELNTGLGEVRVNDLLNANLTSMSVQACVGDLTLRFSGKRPEHDAAVRVEGGVGDLKVMVDEFVRARVEVSGMIRVTTRGSFDRVGERSKGPLDIMLPLGGVYMNQAHYLEDGPALEIEVTMGVGSVTLGPT
jgi:hypothetical protein